MTIECKVDLWEWETCGFDDGRAHEPGRLRVGPPRREVGLHTFSVRATDFEGNVGPTTTYDWRLLGVMTLVHRRPGLRPGHRWRAGDRRRGPELDGDDRVRGQRRRRDVRVLARPRAVRAVHLAGDVHRPAGGRPPAPGRRHRRRTGASSSRPPSTSGRSSSRSTTRRPRPCSTARRPTAAARRSSSSAAPTTRRRRRCCSSSAGSTARTSSTGRSAPTRTTCSSTTRTPTSSWRRARTGSRCARRTSSSR